MWVHSRCEVSILVMGLLDWPTHHKIFLHFGHSQHKDFFVVHTKLQKNITFFFVILLPKVLIRLPKAITSSETLGNHMEKNDQTFIVSLFSQWLGSILAAFFLSVVKFYQKEKLKNWKLKMKWFIRVWISVNWRIE